MIDRRVVGRRFLDYHPEAAPPVYPVELERRRGPRRVGDRDRGVDALLPGKRRRPRVLFSGILRCAHCGRELRRARNLSSEGRKYFIAEYAFESKRPQCVCQATHSTLEWIFQAGTE